MAGLLSKGKRGLMVSSVFVAIFALVSCSGENDDYVINNNEATYTTNCERETIMRYGLSWCSNCDNAPVNRIDNAVPNYVPAMDYANMLGMEAEWLRNEYCTISGRTLVYMNFTFGGRTEEIDGWLDSDDVVMIDPRAFRNSFPELEQTIPTGGLPVFGERRAGYWQTIFRDMMMDDLERGGHLMIGTHYSHAWIEYIPHYSTGLAPFSIGFLGEIMFNSSRIWRMTGEVAFAGYTTAVIGEQIYNVVRWVDCVLGYCYGINYIGELVIGSPAQFYMNITNSVWFAATAWTHATGVYIPYFNFTNPIDPFIISPIVYHHNFINMYEGRPWFYWQR